ncbi:Antitoxin DinJ [Limihaloglobus sulfuriphilus]|uniref:Antitoxin DinJ n=1 Tax=Limihaloglobus sulfuriphilus TaxID=1851148 RepID=A0A1Q2MF05_9BACT|nr:type II toxin-antitoxin system RelB/DinJ family antitoxin [Limihaloglobus sulfuriphilus]AQQ71239.1 Antitoxin DinJ [Limihaloglobus sulfuriphilus]
MSIVTINAKIDSETKNAAKSVLNDLGLNMSEAINLFFKQVVYTKSIPFELKLPNKTTLETFKNTDNGRDLHRVSDVNHLAEELND